MQTPSARQALHLLFSQKWENYGKIKMRKWILRMKKNLISTKLEMSIFSLQTHSMFYLYPHDDQQAKNILSSLCWEYECPTIDIIFIGIT